MSSSKPSISQYYKKPLTQEQLSEYRYNLVTYIELLRELDLQVIEPAGQGDEIKSDNSADGNDNNIEARQ